MTTEDLMRLADAYAETMYLRQDRYKARQALLDALEALGREVARLTVERDVNKRMRDQHFAELEDVRSQVATINAGFNNVQTDRDQIAEHRDHIAKVNDTIRAELAAIRAQEPVAVVESDAPGGIAYTPAGLELVDGQELYASPAAKDAGLVAVFAGAYWKACESSRPEDWLEAALTAQRILRSEKPASPKLGGV